MSEREPRQWMDEVENLTDPWQEKITAEVEKWEEVVGNQALGQRIAFTHLLIMELLQSNTLMGEPRYDDD